MWLLIFVKFGNQSETITLKTVSISIDVFLSQLNATQSRHKSHGSHKQCQHNVVMDTAVSAKQFVNIDCSLFQSLLYRCPEGYLFSSSTLRCKKEEDVSCVESVETRNIVTIQLTVDMLEQFFNKWSQ